MSDKKTTPGRWVLFALVLLALAGVIGTVAWQSIPHGNTRKIENYEPWSAETIALAESLPVQDGGRVKPFSTWAGFMMLRMHGSRSITVESGGKNIRIGPTAWMLDCLFRPHLSIKMPTFRVDNSDALAAAGVKTGARRDRYSYEDLEPGIDHLQELAKSFQGIETKNLDPVQKQVMDLSANVQSYIGLVNGFAFARHGVDMSDDEHPGRTTDMSVVMSIAGEIRGIRDKAAAERTPIPPHVVRMIRDVVELANDANAGLRGIPARDAKDMSWHSAGQEIMAVMEGEAPQAEKSVADIKMMENLARSAGDAKLFQEQLAKWRSDVIARAEARREGRTAATEAWYNRADLFFNALVWYMFGALVMGGMLFAEFGFGLKRAGTWLRGTAALCGTAAFVMSVVAIAVRCRIMGRPPVGNLYDTIIFIATAIAGFFLLLELMLALMKRREFRGVALAMGLAGGTGLLLLAGLYESGDATDHMDPLVAVLSSNRWLTIHVITITLGYAAGLATAFLGVIYVLLRGLGLAREAPELSRMLTRVAYGCVCLTLFLSLTGTVLGGIWANDSWGRFWGWDPKENGALLIVIWNLAILHARLGGLIRDWGLHFAAIAGAAIVGFSWWHVNFLSVGLHSYGFTSGKGAIWMFYGFIVALLLFGTVMRGVERMGKR